MSEHAYVVLFVSVSVWEDPSVQYMDMQMHVPKKS